jgi:hypothetical protein
MLYELVRTVVQKILQDKILLALVVIAIVGLFVGGVAIEEKQEHEQAKTAQGPAPAQGPVQAGDLTPEVASDFIKFWIGGAMDYNAATAQENHKLALAWMTPEAARGFMSSLWTPETASAVVGGQTVATFQPVSVQPAAVNPDGSVVVTVGGNFLIQGPGQPASQQQFLEDFLVRRTKEGLRVAGLYNRLQAR